MGGRKRCRAGAGGGISASYPLSLPATNATRLRKGAKATKQSREKEELDYFADARNDGYRPAIDYRQKPRIFRGFFVAAYCKRIQMHSVIKHRSATEAWNWTSEKTFSA
jgi:hypothetical protein